jgi:hypothetical protein
MTYEEIVKEIEATGVSFTDFVLREEKGISAEDEKALGDLVNKYELTYKESEVDRDGDGFRTYKFKNYDIYVEYDYFYSSYGGSDYGDSVAYQVEPVQIVKTIYQQVKK